MAEAQLVKSIFTRTPDQETIVADVYKSTGDASVNSYQDITGTSSDLLGSISFLSKFQSGLSLTGPTVEHAESLKDSVNSALGGASSSSKSMIGDLLGKAKTAFSSVSGATKAISGTLRTGSDAYTSINGIVKAVKSGNLSDVRNISNTLNSITGKTSVLLSANGAVGKIYGTVVDQAGAAGIADSFKLVSDAVRENTSLVNKSTILYSMASTSLPGALGRGDVRSVASMVDSLGSGAVSMMNPSAVSQLAKNNRSPIIPSQVGGPNGQFVEYQGAYTKIDPNWNKSSFKSGGQQIMDLSKLMDASKETKNLFSCGAKMSSDPSTRWYSALDVFDTKPTVDSVIKKSYPMSTATNLPPMQTSDTDPRVRPEWWDKVTLA